MIKNVFFILIWSMGCRVETEDSPNNQKMEEEKNYPILTELDALITDEMSMAHTVRSG